MIYQCSAEQKLIINDHVELNSQMMQKVSKIENEKVCMFDVCGYNPSASCKPVLIILIWMHSFFFKVTRMISRIKSRY